MFVVRIKLATGKNRVLLKARPSLYKGLVRHGFGSVLSVPGDIDIVITASNVWTHICDVKF